MAEFRPIAQAMLGWPVEKEPIFVEICHINASPFAPVWRPDWHESQRS